MRSANSLSQPQKTATKQPAINKMVARLRGQFDVSAQMMRSLKLRVDKSTSLYEVHTARGRRDLVLGKGLTAEEALRNVVMRINSHTYHKIFRAHPAQLPSPNPKVIPFTIGAYGPSQLWDAVDAFSAFGPVSRAKKLRLLLRNGFENMDKRLDSERVSKVLSDVLHAADVFGSESKRQVMIRVERTLYHRATVAAHEYQQTLSTLAVSCIAYALCRHQEVKESA